MTMAMRLMGAALAAMMLAAPATAARDDRPLGPEIWNGLRVGMTRAQVKSIVPQRSLSLSPYCDGLIRPRFEKGRLVQVRIEGAGRNAPGQNCGEIVRQSLMTRYGARDERSFNRYGRWDERRFPRALYALVRDIDAEKASAIAWDLPTQQILFVARGKRNDWRLTTAQLRDWRVIYIATPRPAGQPIPAL